MRDLQTLFPAPPKDPSTLSSHQIPKITSEVSGDTIAVDFLGFFYNPPKDFNLHQLMPTDYRAHEDLVGLTDNVYGKMGDKLTFDQGDSKAKLQFKDGPTVEFRNYLYGRASGWNKEAYATLFPGLSSGQEVADRERILNETRGGRPAMNTLMIFIK